MLVNSLPNNKILDWSKLKAFADDKNNFTQNLNFVLGRVEKFWEKEKMLVTDSLHCMDFKEIQPFFQILK